MLNHAGHQAPGTGTKRVASSYWHPSCYSTANSLTYPGYIPDLVKKARLRKVHFCGNRMAYPTFPPEVFRLHAQAYCTHPLVLYLSSLHTQQVVALQAWHVKLTEWDKHKKVNWSQNLHRKLKTASKLHNLFADHDPRGATHRLFKAAYAMGKSSTLAQAHKGHGNQRAKQHPEKQRGGPESSDWSEHSQQGWPE